MTKEQAVDFLMTIYRLEVESRSKEFRDSKFVKECVEKAAEFLTGGTNKRGLFFCGYIGNGKTTLLRSISKLYSYLASEGYIEYNDSTKGFEFIGAKELSLMIIKDEKRYDMLKSTRMLIIDDLGEDAMEVTLYGVNYTPVKDVLMYRYEKGLITLISSNLNASQIKEKYHDERLSDRIREMYEVVAFKDKSFR